MSHSALGEQFHPHVDQYRSGGIGHLSDDESRSVVGFVPTHTLVPYRDHDGTRDGLMSHDTVDRIAADIHAGVGIKNPIHVEYDHEKQLGYIGEGNHRLAAAVKAGAPVVPVRVYGRARIGGARLERGVGAPLSLATTWKGGMGEDYVPPEVHPLHFQQFKDAR